MHNFFYEFPLHFDREYFWKNRRHHHKNEKIHKITTEAVSKKCRKTLFFHHSYLNCFDLHVCFYFLLFGFFDTKSVSIALSSYPIRLNINGILTISDVMLIIFIPKFFVLFIEWKCGPINDLPQSMHVCLNVCVWVCAPKHRYAPNIETFVLVFFSFPHRNHLFTAAIITLLLLLLLLLLPLFFVRQEKSVFTESLIVGSCWVRMQCKRKLI